MNANKKHLALNVALVLGSLIASQHLAAQPSDQLEEIVVTATKRGEQNLMDVPLPVTAFFGEDIERQGSNTLTDFINRAPGLTLTPLNPGNTVIQIRGVSSLFGDPTVGLYMDDVPFSTVVNLEFPEVPTFDLASVEVLRGPQGTLYGASSQGGTVIINTMDADTSEFSGKLNMSGSYTEDGDPSYGLKGAINIPVVEDVLGLRFVAGIDETGGFVDDSSLDKKNVNDTTLENYRAKLTWTPTERLRIRGGVWLQELEADGFNVADDDLDRPQGATTLFYADRTGVTSEFADYDYDVYNLVVEYEFESFDIYSATSYLEFEEQIFDSTLINDDGTGNIAFSVAYDNRTIENISQEIRLVSRNDGPLQWTLGGLYNDNETTFLFSSGPDNPGIVDELVESESWAVFGELTWSMLDDRLDITGGLRYYEDDRTDTELPTSLSAIFLEFAGVPATREASFDTWQPKLNVSYRPNDETMVYFNAARGFRSGIIQPGGVVALNGLNGFFPLLSIDEEPLWSYDVGAKGVLLGSRLSYDVAVYYIDWEDIQLFGAEPGVGIAFSFAGPDAEIYGIDWDVTYATTLDGLTLSTTGNINSAEYVGDGVYVDPNGRVGDSGVSDGDRIFNVPEYTFSAAADYIFDWASLGGTGVANIEIQYNSKREDIANNAEGDSNTFLNARFGLEKDSYSVYLFGTNLTNEDGSLFPVAAEQCALGAAFTSRAQPRTIGINLAFNFQ